jgi:Tfp pilus assembly protein PilZ
VQVYPVLKRARDGATVLTIKVICPTKNEFSANYLEEFPHGGFFIPTRLRLEPGEPVRLSLRIGSRATPVLLRAIVRRIQGGKISPPKLRAGIAVEFLPSEAHGRDHLLAIARRRDAVHSGRRRQRLPLELPVGWSVRKSPRVGAGLLHDISIGGASIRTKDWMGERTDVFVTLVPPGAAVPMAMLGRVAWTDPGKGFGVSWRSRDKGGIRRIKELVRRLEEVTESHESHGAVFGQNLSANGSRVPAGAALPR